MRRRTPLLTNHIYHIYNKSIFGYKIFNTPHEYQHMLELIQFYCYSKMPTSFSAFQRSYRKDDHFLNAFAIYQKTFQLTSLQPLVHILAYCLMPTHFHFQLEQLMPDGISLFMKNIQSSYTQYFNNRHNRRGPLWQSRFGNNLIEDDLGLLRNSLYIHANPVKDLSISSADKWPYSSYKEFIEKPAYSSSICNFSKFKHIFSPNYENQMCNYLINLPTSGK